MLQRQRSSQGIVYYQSRLLAGVGVPHGFSTRLGGISPAPFDSMNMGNPSGCAVQDDYSRIWENYRLFQAAIGAGGRELLHVHQIHGGAIAVALPGKPFDVATKADAIIGSDAGQVLSVRVADCVPVLLSNADGSVVAAVHAGWRGVIAGVVIHALSAVLNRCNAKADTALAAIGPCISKAEFEVGPEVLAAFENSFGDDAPIERRADGKGYVDLRQALRQQLLRAGVPDSHIDSTDRCTARDVDEFFSHRKQNGVTGRMAALISPH